MLGFLNVHIMDLFVRISFSIKNPKKHKEFCVTLSSSSWKHILWYLVAEITEVRPVKEPSESGR